MHSFCIVFGVGVFEKLFRKLEELVLAQLLNYECINGHFNILIWKLHLPKTLAQT